MRSPRRRRRRSHDEPARSAAVPVDGRRGRPRDVAGARRPCRSSAAPAAAVLLLQSGRCRRQHRGLVGAKARSGSICASRCWNRRSPSRSARSPACWSASGSPASSCVAAIFDPYVKMANALPRVVLAPIFALWLGLGIWSKVALGVTLVFFIVFFNVYQGVKEVSPTVLANGAHARHERAAIDCGTSTGRRRCRGCSPRCTRRSASPWSARWSANISDRRRGSAT